MCHVVRDEVPRGPVVLARGGDGGVVADKRVDVMSGDERAGGLGRLAAACEDEEGEGDVEEERDGGEMIFFRGALAWLEARRWGR